MSVSRDFHMLGKITTGKVEKLDCLSILPYGSVYAALSYFANYNCPPICLLFQTANAHLAF